MGQRICDLVKTTLPPRRRTFFTRISIHNKKKQERKAAVVRAEGESEAARLISEATKAAGVGLIELRRIEAARDIASTLGKSPRVAYVPEGSNVWLKM